MRLLMIPGVFAPRSDSRLLARLLAAVIEPGRTVLDPFTGTGVLAVTAALAGAEVDRGRRLAARGRLRMAQWTHQRGADCVRRGDMFAPVRGERFDAHRRQPALPTHALGRRSPGALRAHGREGPMDGGCSTACAATAPTHLAPGGRAACRPFIGVRFRGDGRHPRPRRRVTSRRSPASRGPLGPLVRNRAPALERRGILAPGQRDEDIVVFSAAPRATCRAGHRGVRRSDDRRTPDALSGRPLSGPRRVRAHRPGGQLIHARRRDDRALPLRRLAHQAVLRRHAQDDRLPGAERPAQILR